MNQKNGCVKSTDLYQDNGTVWAHKKWNIVFFNAVTTSAFDKIYLRFDHDMLVPVLVKCVQELN